jgi:arabinose-5-phosphate isomerase
LDDAFARAVDAMVACRGRVVVSGMGKSGLVGQKISATLASTGTPSLFLHAAEALHGDLGRLAADDLVLVLSNSGESEEVVQLIRPIKWIGARLVVMTGEPQSTLAQHADICLSIGVIDEACPMGLAPTASTTAMLVLGDALAVCAFHQRGLKSEDYARFHPAGALGRKFLRVADVMRRGEENPRVREAATMHDALVAMTETPGRPGATSVVDADGRLVGFFTDGDLRRLLEKQEFSLQRGIAGVMQKHPKSVRHDQLVVEAARLLQQYKIDQVPVVDEANRVAGLLDVQDLLSARIIVPD